MVKSFLGQNTYTVYKGSIGTSKTMYQIMQSPNNTTIGEIGINYVYQSSYSSYGINYFRIGRSVGNWYPDNIGWGSAQSFGCSEHSGGSWGVNSFTCVQYGIGSLYSAKIYIK